MNTAAVTDSDSGGWRGNEEIVIAAVGSTEKHEASDANTERSLLWWEKAIGRKKQGIEHHV